VWGVMLRSPEKIVPLARGRARRAGIADV